MNFQKKVYYTRIYMNTYTYIYTWVPHEQ